MSDPLTNLPFGGNPGEAVAEVDPDDLKTFWHETRKLQAKFPGQSVGILDEAIKPSASQERTRMPSGIAQA